ncbi:beta-N-acetylhexosaminidase [Nonomuraea sp. NPDC005692]|uniref:beta-N-acetylhexosaminidase n=1 Tax=Nonomuraea sp. NPDC005692 TaxID=3157168 RepID=UPI0033C3CA13
MLRPAARPVTDRRSRPRTPQGPVLLLPRPVHVTPDGGEPFALTATTVIAAPPGLSRVEGWLRAALSPATGLPLPAGAPGPGAIEFVLTAGLGPEGYRLTVRPDGVRVEAGDAAGAFYGAQTLRQLLPPAAFRRGAVGEQDWLLAPVTVADRPRFRWRGCLIDVARHFLPKPDLLRYIDLLAAHKLNVLHLHLTDDQGWRLEVKGYPKLTEVGAWRRESPLGDRRHGVFDGRPHGGFYTQDDLREIVSYAADRFVTVVPEIELPGHSQAAIAAYPELGNLDEQLEVATGWGVSPNVLNVEDATLAFYRDVLDQVMEIFPGEYVCVGGDECPKEQWRQSPSAQRRIAELGLRDEEELQSWFIRQFSDHLAARGRRLLGWDEIIEGGLPPGATVASWRGTYGAVAAARAGHDVVTCPFTELYLDFRQSDRPDEPVPIGNVISLRDVHAYEPVPPELTEAEAARVLGAQANLWTEHIDSPRGLDYMAFPRLSAFAEVVWSPAGGDFDDFRARLHHHERRLAALGVEYRKETGPEPWQTRPDVRGRPRERAETEAEVAAWTRDLRRNLSEGKRA